MLTQTGPAKASAAGLHAAFLDFLAQCFVMEHALGVVSEHFRGVSQEDVRAMSQCGDAVVVGSALVERIGKGEDVAPVVQTLAAALRPAQKAA